MNWTNLIAFVSFLIIRNERLHSPSKLAKKMLLVKVFLLRFLPERGRSQKIAFCML